MNLTDRLKGAIARLERANQWHTIVEIHHEGGLIEGQEQPYQAFEHGYSAGYDAGYDAGRAEYMQPRPITSAEIDMMNEHAGEVQRRRDAGEPA